MTNLLQHKRTTLGSRTQPMKYSETLTLILCVLLTTPPDMDWSILQQMQGFTSPQLHTTRRWITGSGIIAVLDAVSRSDLRPPKDPEYITGAVMLSLSLLALNLHPDPESNTLAAKQACLNLAATLRKLLYPVCYTALADKGRKLSILQLGMLLESHISTLLAFNEPSRGKGHQGHRTSLAPHSSNSLAPHNGKCGSNHCSSDRSDRSSRSSHNSSTSTQPLYHQIQAVLMTSVVQLSYSLREPEAKKSCINTAEVVAWGRHMSERLEGIVCNGLPGLLSSRISEVLSNPARAQSEVGPHWERYALEHFGGRLLPGCCHLGCTNLGSSTEAALPTLLCSGCRRARYCSVKCQHGAWLQGGHGAVCGVHV